MYCVTAVISTDKKVGKVNVNGSAVAGIIEIGQKYSQLKQFICRLNVPVLPGNFYYKVEDSLRKFLKIVVLKACLLLVKRTQNLQKKVAK